MKNMSKLCVVLMVLVFAFSMSLTVAAGEKKEASKTEEIKCPVCKTTVTPETAKAKLVYEGKTYYFDGEGCAEKFKKDPHAYHKCEDAGKTFYVCSMCDGVKSDKPGKCPKCGMELQKKVHECAHHKKESKKEEKKKD